MQGNGEGAKPALVLCAGQACPAQNRCARWRTRRHGAAYASFDIERTNAVEAAKAGDTAEKVRAQLCPAFVQVTFVRSRSRH